MPGLLAPIRLAVAATAIGLALVAPVPALADCAPAPGLEQAIGEADLVFVGAVTGVEHDGRSATVEVTEIWRGGEMPATVTVLGGLDPAQPMEDDRTFQAGVEYLFVPSVVDGRMVDGICSATTPWTDNLTALRTVDAHSPTPSATVSGDEPAAIVGELALPIVTAALIGGAAITIAFVVARRRDA